MVSSRRIYLFSLLCTCSLVLVQASRDSDKAKQFKAKQLKAKQALFVKKMSLLDKPQSVLNHDPRCSGQSFNNLREESPITPLVASQVFKRSEQFFEYSPVTYPITPLPAVSRPAPQGSGQFVDYRPVKNPSSPLPAESRPAPKGSKLFSSHPRDRYPTTPLPAVSRPATQGSGQLAGYPPEKNPSSPLPAESRPAANLSNSFSSHPRVRYPFTPLPDASGCDQRVSHKFNNYFSSAHECPEGKKYDKIKSECVKAVKGSLKRNQNKRGKQNRL